MRVREVMTPHADTVDVGLTLDQAAYIMRERNVGFLPVKERGRIIGILTDRDIVIRAVAEGLVPHEIMVQDVMSREIRFCYDDQDLRVTLELMRERHIHRLLVMNRQEDLVGIISLGDILSRANPHLNGETLRNILL